MKTAKTVVATLIVVAVLVPLVVLGVIYSGVYNVAATDEHWPVTVWLLNTTVQQSVIRHARGVDVPALDSRHKVLAGAANYAAMCAGCHAAPGKEQGLPAVAMVPQPPRLDKVAVAVTPAQMFWVIKHGIKASGMPAWGPSHSAAELWSIVAFARKLPQMDAAEYQQLLRSAEAKGLGHHQGGGHHSHQHGGDSHHHSSKPHSHHHGAGQQGHHHGGGQHPHHHHEQGGHHHPHGADGHSH